MDKPKLNLRHLAIEAVLIVFTVSLALALSEWRLQVKKDQLVERVKISLKSETEKNIEKLKKVISYHDSLLTNIRNGEHTMISTPLSVLPFNPHIDKELSSFVRSQVYSSSSNYVDPIEIIRDNESRYLRMGDALSTIVIKNDSLFVYGAGNIVLRSAEISNNSWQIAQATNTLIELDYDLISILGRINSQFEDYKSTTDMALKILYSDSGQIQSALEDMFSMENQLLERYESVLLKLNAEQI
ncbi:hypothetical protein [Ekhidna sp. To15]|uniref:hypothetical protein n=1 Tax=Ekhidna sp. To15 TaxID=3395267 RepID=UPI003F52166B